jgi:hypothetical protein
MAAPTEGHYFTGYTLDELYGVWDRRIRIAEWQTLYYIMTGSLPYKIPVIKPGDRLLAELRSGRRVICSACGEAKLRNEYYTDNRKRNKLYSECKECHRKLVQRRELALKQVRFSERLKKAA